MVYSMAVPPYTIADINQYNCSYNNFPNYALLLIDKESYICSSVIENSDEGQVSDDRVIHNLQVGRYCSLSNDIYFLIGRGKDYSRITTSAAKVFHQAPNVFQKHREKGSIIIENDVWIGRKASIMSGVTVHNGAIVSAMAHVVKDVPPYAIVGGNPARVIGYRFDEEVIKKMQTIQWWYWTEEKIEENANYFNDDVESFCSRFYNEAKEEVEKIVSKAEKCEKDRYFILLDYDDNYPVTPDAVDEFLDVNGMNKEKELIVFYNGGSQKSGFARQLQEIIAKFNKNPQIQCSIQWREGGMEQIKELMPTIKHLIINRRPETVRLMCYADLYGEEVEIISGVDLPILK